MRISPTRSLLLLTLVACHSDERPLPNASGAPGEVLVVMDKGHWESDAGAAVRGVLEQYFIRLPQREAHFRVAQCTHGQFGGLLQHHKNILLTDIGPAFDSVSVQKQVDRYARGQVVVQITAPDVAQWITAIQQRADRVQDIFDKAERERLIASLHRAHDQALTSSIEARHQFIVEVPEGFQVAKESGNMTWLRRQRLVSGAGLEHTVQEGLLIYHHPYVSDSTFTLEGLVAMRDSVSKMYVEGPDPGTYMITQRRFEDIDLMPLLRTVDFGERFAMEMRGLWAMHGMRMGGPFVSLSVLDEPRQRVVTAEGYIYAPQFDKREYLRTLEAVIYSLRFPEDPLP